MSSISEFFHSGIPYILVSLFFVVYSVKTYIILKKIERNTRIYGGDYTLTENQVLSKIMRADTREGNLKRAEEKMFKMQGKSKLK